MPPSASGITDRKAQFRLWGARVLLFAELAAWLAWVIVQITADNDSAAEGLSRIGSIALITVTLVVSFRSLRDTAGWHRTL